MVGKMKKLMLGLVVLILCAVSVSAVEVPLYKTNYIELSRPSGGTCSVYEGQCYYATQYSENGVLKNCLTIGSDCHCEFWGCGYFEGITASCSGGRCLGTDYPDGSPCHNTGYHTYYCSSSVCNYNSRCGAIGECAKLSGEIRNINGKLGTISNCKPTADKLICDCDWNELVSAEPVLQPVPPEVPELSWWDKLLMFIFPSRRPITSCVNLCEEGEQKCMGNSMGFCEPMANGCLDWAYYPLNFNNFFCSSGGIIATGNTNTYCKSGTHFELGCSGVFFFCTVTQCETGKCASTTHCAEACSDTCASLGYQCGPAWVCGKNVNCGNCGVGQVCDNNRCVSSCSNECTLGEKECVDGTSFRECKLVDGCQQWGLKQSCPAGTECIGFGVCLPPVNTYKKCVENACVVVVGDAEDECKVDGDCYKDDEEDFTLMWFIIGGLGILLVTLIMFMVFMPKPTNVRRRR